MDAAPSARHGNRASGIRPTGRYSRRNRTTGVEAARQPPSEGGARRSFPDAAPSPRRASPSERRRSRRRMTGGCRKGRRERAGEARYATQPAHPEVSPRAPAPRACRLRVGIPAKWMLADVPGLRHVRHPPTDAAQPMAAAPSAPPRIPIRTPAVAAADDGRLAAGRPAVGKWGLRRPAGIERRSACIALAARRAKRGPSEAPQPFPARRSVQSCWGTPV